MTVGFARFGLICLGGVTLSLACGASLEPGAAGEGAVAGRNHADPGLGGMGGGDAVNDPSGNGGSSMVAGGKTNAGDKTSAGGDSNAEGGTGGGGKTSAGGKTSTGGEANAGAEPSVDGAAGGADQPAAVCGDHVREGRETCDDGNVVPFDGCGATCQAEPKCNDSGCTSTCGDGLVIAEECDDGNKRSGDGCSAYCEIEPGFTCAPSADCERIAGECVLRVPVIYRDLTVKHPDIEPSCNGNDDGLAATRGLVQASLLNGKPVASASAQSGCITRLDDWYADSGSPAIVRDLVLFDNGDGAYVNRFGALGEQWAAPTTYKSGRFCGNGDTHCLAEPPFAGCDFDPLVDTCLYPCPPSLGDLNDSCAAIVTPGKKYDGTPLFFPLDDQLKNEPWLDAKIPAQYGYNWEFEDLVYPVSGASHVAGARLHNFHFTTQIASWFKYDATSALQLGFTGDDDAWVFVNGRLAVDLGGVHQPVDGSVTIDATTAASFGLEDGGVYRIDVFHAERLQESSALRMTLPRFDLSRSECTPL